MLIFQYGSNTSEKRLNAAERLSGDARLIGAFETEAAHELEFTVWSDVNTCAAANIATGAGRRIWGAVYDIPDHLMARETAGQRRSMDAIEGGRYARADISILDPATQLDALTAIQLSRMW